MDEMNQKIIGYENQINETKKQMQSMSKNLYDLEEK